MDEHFAIEEQIRRCRRLASYVTDEDLRRSLEELAEKYEARLPKQSGSFMLGSASRDHD